jgi:hypothetical protein
MASRLAINCREDFIADFGALFRICQIKALAEAARP